MSFRSFRGRSTRSCSAMTGMARALALPMAAAVSILITCTTVSAPALAQSRFEALLQKFGAAKTADGISHSNGRLEAQTVDVATKYAGRINAVGAQEGDLLGAGDAVAQMDTADTQAQLNAAKAQLLQARAAKAVAQATLVQAQSAQTVAQTTYDRVVKLHENGNAAQSVLDDAANTLTSAGATVTMAEAQIESSDAQIAAAQAAVDQVQLALDDLTIKSPIRGRVLYRLHEPGEVVSAGSPIVTMLDLSNVYMNIYLPASVVGTLAIGDEARLILDPVPDYVVPAQITFVAPEAQFTPKSVETEAEREELVFRVKLSIPRNLLAKFEDRIKSGVRGIGFVRTGPDAAWPADLQVKLPE